jgi:hypothetical protein
MNNIKSLEVIKPAYGLKVGDILSRTSGDSAFSIVVEEVGDGYEYASSVSLSESLINKDHFKAIEWFETRLTNKQIITDLENKVSTLESQIDDADAVKERLATKLIEFETRYAQLQGELESRVNYGNMIGWNSEEMAVLFNLIDFIKKMLS